jgi:hypothetical protein
VEKEHIILPVLLNGEGPFYPSGAPKEKMFLLQLGAPEG